MYTKWSFKQPGCCNSWGLSPQNNKRPSHSQCNISVTSQLVPVTVSNRSLQSVTSQSLCHQSFTQLPVSHSVTSQSLSDRSISHSPVNQSFTGQFIIHWSINYSLVNRSFTSQSLSLCKKACSENCDILIGSLEFLVWLTACTQIKYSQESLFAWSVLNYWSAIKCVQNGPYPLIQKSLFLNVYNNKEYLEGIPNLRKSVNSESWPLVSQQSVQLWICHDLWWIVLSNCIHDLLLSNPQPCHL